MKSLPPQVLNSTSYNKIFTSLNTHIFQRSGIPWESTTVNTKIFVLVNIASATALQLANGWLTWQFNMYYNQRLGAFRGTVYSDPEQSALDLSVCINSFR
jgi:hypothetical protein